MPGAEPPSPVPGPLGESIRMESPTSLRRNSCEYTDHKHTLPTAHGRNLVVCIDGTSNQFGSRNTNVIELYHLLKKDDFQLTYYDSGIGTYAQPSKKSFSYFFSKLSNAIDLAVAWDIRKTIIGAYSWLSANFRPGDRIYLFGFSRGAYQVRALSAMIEKVGLIHKGNEAQIPFAYELYADPKSDHSSEDAETSRAERFKHTFSRNVRIHFVGAWDTVSSVGIIRNETLPLTTDGMRHVCHFRHALALDERRVKFLPEYAYSGVTQKPPECGGRACDKSKHRTQHRAERGYGLKVTNTDTDDLKSQEKDTVGQNGDVKEVWFAGTHSDIGGGSVANENLDRSGPPLLWMLSEAMKCDLQVNERVETSKRWNWGNKVDIHESLTTMWRPLEWLPIKRLTYRSIDHTTRRPHRGQGRKILLGQRLHGSLFLDSENKYKPRASIRVQNRDGLTWDDLRKDQDNWLEKDLLGEVLVLASKLDMRDRDNLDPQSLDELMRVVDSPGGQWSIGKAPGFTETLEKIIEPILNDDTMRDKRDRLVQVFLDAEITIMSRPLFNFLLAIVLDASAPHRQLRQLVRIRAVLNDFAARDGIVWVDHDHPKKDGVKLDETEIALLCDAGKLALFYTPKPNNTDTLPPKITSVAFSLNGDHIVSGSDDGMIRICEKQTGRCTRTIRGFSNRIRCVTVSPDGNRIASCGDKVIRIWDFATGAMVGEPLKGHKKNVRSISFSPDGAYVVSGSEDRTVRIWSLAKNRQVRQLSGHTDWVRSIAISADGKHIASGSDDKTIRIWTIEDMEGDAIPDPIELKGHTNFIESVSFIDNQHIVSGSWDHTVRVWDLTNPEKPAKEMKDHLDVVHSVAVSQDGTLIASGADDKTIRIWNWKAEPGRSVPLTGHTDYLNSVKFSPDVKYVVSGSRDGSIRRWLLEEVKANLGVSKT